MRSAIGPTRRDGWSTRCFARSPDNLEALLLSADIAFAKQRADDALASLNRAATLAPDNPRVLLPRARVRLQTGSINEAEKDVSRVLERAPRDVMARYMKASIQLLRGNANAARATFQPIEGALATIRRRCCWVA